MTRLDQGHLHSKLEVPGLTCPGRNRTRASTVRSEHSRKEKSHSNSLLIATRNSYIYERANSGECSRHKNIFCKKCKCHEPYFCWRDVDLPVVVDLSIERFVHRVGALQPEANQTHPE
jgi:hypothetical protein